MKSRLERLAASYISNLEGLIHTQEMSNSEVARRLRDYTADSRHYFAKGDYTTSLVCACYAEGLADGHALSKGNKTQWVNTAKKVLVVGTWDLIHPGHIALLWEAKRLGRVYVVVATDANVEKAKGRPPIVPAEQRAEVVRNLKPVDQVMVGDEHDFLRPVRQVDPDIILLGPDDPYPEEKLKTQLKERGLHAKVARATKRYTNYPLNSSSQIIARVKDVITFS